MTRVGSVSAEHRYDTDTLMCMHHTDREKTTLPQTEAYVTSLGLLKVWDPSSSSVLPQALYNT